MEVLEASAVTRPACEYYKHDYPGQSYCVFVWFNFMLDNRMAINQLSVKILPGLGVVVIIIVILSRVKIIQQ